MTTRPAPPGGPARPPFPFRVAAPAGWHVLRGEAPALRDDLLALLARGPLWTGLDERRRRGAVEVASALARAGAAAGSIATLVHVAPGGTTAAPRVSSVSLTWWRTAPLIADLDLAGLLVDSEQEVSTGVGPARVRRSVEPDAAGHVGVQVAAPVPDSVWLALLTATTSDRGSADALDAAVQEVADSLQVARPTPGTT